MELQRKRGKYGGMPEEREAAGSLQRGEGKGGGGA